MSVLLIAILLLVAAGGTAVVLTREPHAQCVVLCFFGLTLAILFMAFQAADVALSELAVGSVALPLMILLTLAKLKRGRQNGKES